MAKRNTSPSPERKMTRRSRWEAKIWGSTPVTRLSNPIEVHTFPFRNEGVWGIPFSSHKHLFSFLDTVGIQFVRLFAFFFEYKSLHERILIVYHDQYFQKAAFCFE